MIRCRDVTEVTGELKSLPWWRRPELWFHLGICSACRAYAKQMELIRNGCRKILKSQIDESAEKELTKKVLEELDKRG